ncbi:MAG: hypothetical protein GY809_13740, partial [Planctomycetes bacterium]|nr:hypothetical protein [Planctomycetota bacterium]
ALGFVNWLWETRDTARTWTKRFFDLPGLNVPMTSDLNQEQIGGWHQYTHSATTVGWLGHHFYLHWRYGMDRDFMRDRAYPWLREASVFFDAITEKRLCLDDDLVKDRILERPEFIERVNQALEEHQCISDIALTSDCPECRHTMKSIFDIVHVLDADITHAAGLFLEEIHQLATAYGWTEDTIFSVPRTRRNWYVKRIQAK